MEILYQKSLIISLHRQIGFPENELRYRDNIERLATLFKFEGITGVDDSTNRTKPLRIEFRNGKITDIKIDNLILEGRRITIVTNSSTEDSEKAIKPCLFDFFQSLVGNVNLKEVITTYQSIITSRLDCSINNIFSGKFLEYIKCFSNDQPSLVLFNMLNFKATYTTPVEISHENIYLSKKDFRFVKNDALMPNENIFDTEMPLETQKHIELIKKFENLFAF